MAKLSKERREWMQKVYGFEPAARLIREIENLPTQAEADAMVARLKNQVNETHAKSGASSQEHPGMAYFGTAFKGMGSKPTPTLATLQAKAKALSSAIKDVAETAAAQAVRDLLDLSEKLDLNEEAVLRLVTQYGMSEVMSILTTLNQQKAAKGYLMSPFYGRVTKIDVADLNEYVSQAAHKSRKTDSFWK